MTKIDYRPNKAFLDKEGNIARPRGGVIARHNATKMVRGGSFFTDARTYQGLTDDAVEVPIEEAQDEQAA